MHPALAWTLIVILQGVIEEHKHPTQNINLVKGLLPTSGNWEWQYQANAPKINRKSTNKRENEKKTVIKFQYNCTYWFCNFLIL